MNEPQTPTHELKIHVDFNNLRGRLGRAVDHCVRLVSIGYQYSKQPIEEELRMPGSGWSVSYYPADPWSADEATEHYRTWLFASGLRNMLEAFGSFLDECYEIASYIVLIRKQKEKGLLLGEDLFSHQKDTVQYRQLGMKKKVQKLKSLIGTLPEELEESVLSLNRARNILVHHDGVVPETYLDGSGRFRITWKRLTIRATGESDREVHIGDEVNAGERIGLLALRESRDFGKGERIHLEPVEFSGICWTVFTTGDTVREALEKEWSRSSPSSVAVQSHAVEE